MEIIETFGHYVENLTDKKPQSARRLLKTGWEAQNLKFRYMQDKRLMPADRHLANLMMDTMLRPLQKPEDSVIVSIFTPCEMMQEVGLHPYNVEGFSCYLSASKAERAFLQPQRRNVPVCSRQRIRELQRHCAVITRHFLVQRRKDFCQSLNVLFIPT